MFRRTTRPRGTAAVVINADDGPNFFSSTDAALGHIEWQDVENQVWGPGFDREGHRLVLSLVWPESGWPEVEAAIDANGPAQPDDLRTVLLSRVRADETEVDTLTTRQLFALIADRSGVIL